MFFVISSPSQRPQLLDFYTNQLGLAIKFTLDHDYGTAFGWYVDCGNGTFIGIFDQAGAVRQWGGQVIDDVRYLDGNSLPLLTQMCLDPSPSFPYHYAN
jgi:hypothetical protein